MGTQDVAGLSAEKLALLEQRLRGAAVATPMVEQISRRTGSGPAPLSSVQEQLWYFSRVAPGNLVYNDAATIRKEGPLDVRALSIALTEVVRRHEILRSTFEVVDGVPMQHLAPAPTFDLRAIDIGTIAAAEQPREAARLAAEQVTQAYDLSRGPLVRFRLVRFTPERHCLYVAWHQLVLDCLSLYRVILPELVCVYDAATAEREASLPEPRLQYADYAAWTRSPATGEALRDRIEYWRDHLAAAPAVPLPLDHRRPARPRFRGAIERLSIPRELADELRTLGRAYGATLFQVLAAAFAVFLKRWSGRDEIVFGTLGDLRDRSPLEHLVGYCVTPMVLRADMRDDPRFGELAVRIRGDLLTGLSRLVPFEELVRELRPPREAGANPMFQAAIVLAPPAPACDPAWSIRQVEPEAGDAAHNAKFDLLLELDERADGHLENRLIYDIDLFSPQTAARLSRDWLALVRDIGAAPDSRVSELSPDTGRRPGSVPAGAFGRRVAASGPAADEGPIERAVARTALEERITDIWRRMLDVDDVGVHDDFFELGGDSLGVMRLLVELDEQLGEQVSLAAFVEGRVTVARLAAIIDAPPGGAAADQRVDASSESAVSIQPTGDRPTLFFALADERSLLALRHFTGPLGADQPVLALLPDRVDRRFDRAATVEHLSASMLETVRAAQPHGPYFFAGYSLGGMFAYEMASRLRAVGEEVAWVGLLDTCTSDFIARRWQLRKRIVRGWNAGPSAAMRKIGGVGWREVTALLVRLHLREPKLSDAFDHRGALMLATAYHCSGNDAPVDVFATDDTIRGAGSESLGWNEVHRGPLRLNRMGGTHLSMFDAPYVDVLSAMFTRSAREALEATQIR